MMGMLFTEDLKIGDTKFGQIRKLDNKTSIDDDVVVQLPAMLPNLITKET